MQKSQTIVLINKTIRHMSMMKQGMKHGGILLAGDPGLGKTSFVELLGCLLGIKTIVIEVPHITEEHLINIPFLVYNPVTNSTQTGISHESDYKMVLAQSNLYTQILNAQPMNDAAYLKHITQSSQYIQNLYMQLGGTATEVPEIIQFARSNFKVILFLDEFFRKAPMRIRNVLRDILNNRIGMHEIPKSTYILYASNMNDAGLDEMPSNYQFTQTEFKAPTKDDWFGWFTDKFHNNKDVKLDPQIIKHFQEILTDEDISYNDVASDVRTSPRRWEQILLYVNAALPVSNEREAHALLTNVHNNFVHYQTKEKSKDLQTKVLKAVAKLIKDTSNIAAKHTDKLEDSDWRDVLDHQITIQMKLGKHKKHVPIISGPPGIGKAQPLDAKIKIPGGWATMGKTCVGDIITVPSGESASVSGVFPQGILPIYRLTFSDGRTTESCGEHLWKIRKIREDNWRIVSTLEIKRIIDDTNQWVYAPLVSPSTISDIDLPIDPYVLGCLLGDGGMTGRAITFTTADTEMIDTLTSKLMEGYYFNKQSKSKYDYKLVQTKDVQAVGGSTKGTFRNSYIQCLSELELLGKSSLEKFIPNIYKEASLSQKEDLLAGLVDTDGCVNPQGAFSISTSSHALALDIQDMVRSMGGVAPIAVRTPFYMKDDTRKYCALNYNVTIRYPNPRNLSKLARKRDRLPIEYQYKDLQLRVISVDYVGEKEAQCIMVDHSDHLYITDDYVVTHNTTQAFKIAKDHNLRLIPIDISSVYADDVTGLPIPGKSDANKENMSIQFSLPKLYHQIMEQIKEQDALYISKLKEHHGANAQKYINEYEHAPWKYLILLDELNRVDEKTFNSLRKVILEKNFGPAGNNEGEDLKLPKEAIVIGALNPEGVGTADLTSHFRDAVDFIHGKARWDSTVKVLNSLDVKDLKGKSIPNVFGEAALNIVQMFVTKFKTKNDETPINEQPYHLDVGAPVYVSSREYQDLYAGLVQILHHVISNLPQDAKPAEVRQQINDAVADSFDESLSFPLTKAGIDNNEFLNQTRAWVASLPASSFVGLLSKTAKVNTIVDTMGQYLDGKNISNMLDDAALVNAHNASNNAQVIDEVREMFKKKITNEEQVKHYVIDQKQKLLEPKGDNLVHGSESTSLLTNFIMGLIFTLHLHNYANDRLVVIGKALSQAFVEILKKLEDDRSIDPDVFADSRSAIVDLRMKLADVVKTLK